MKYGFFLLGRKAEHIGGTENVEFRISHLKIRIQHFLGGDAAYRTKPSHLCTMAVLTLRAGVCV